MKIHVRFFLQTYIFTYFGQLHKSVISWSYGKDIFNFIGHSQTFPHVVIVS